LAIVGIFLAVQTAIVVFGPLTVNEEIQCGSLYRPDRSLIGTDANLCRRAIAQQRVWSAGYATASSLALVGLVGLVLVSHRR
jgi:hypothetical protein